MPSGNLFPAGTEKTRPEIYAMGFRNPFRITLDKNDVAYITDYSPDSRDPAVGRGPAGTGRMMVVDKPANYGWPMCVQPNLPYIEMNWTTNPIFPVAPFDCAAPKNTSRHNTGLTDLPPVEKSELWYSFNAPTPCPESYLSTPTQTCPVLFPELGTGGVGPHGAAKYDYDPNLKSETKFPEYYDGAIFRRVRPGHPQGDPAGRQGRHPEDQQCAELRAGAAAQRCRPWPTTRPGKPRAPADKAGPGSPGGPAGGRGRQATRTDATSLMM